MLSQTMSVSSSCKDPSSNDDTSSFPFSAKSASIFTQKGSFTNLITSLEMPISSNPVAKLFFSESTKPDVTFLSVGKWRILPGPRSAEKSECMKFLHKFSNCFISALQLHVELVQMMENIAQKANRGIELIHFPSETETCQLFSVLKTGETPESPLLFHKIKAFPLLSHLMLL